MNALRSISPSSVLSNWKKYVGSIFIVRFFHKPRDTNPNKYPSSTLSNIGIENEDDIRMPANSQILLNIYEVIQSRLLVLWARCFSHIAFNCLTIMTGYWAIFLGNIFNLIEQNSIKIK